MAKTKLTRKQMIFCQEYLKDLNILQAAKRARYSRAQASRLMINPLVLSVIAADAEIQAEKAGIEVDYVLKGIREVVERDKVKDTDKLKGLELLGRYLAMFTDKHDHTTGGEPLAAPIINVSVGKSDG